jgi:hypothetical protein
VVNPDLFGGLSQSEIARLLGTQKMNISRHAAEFSRRFGVRNRGQSHAWNLRVGKAPEAQVLPAEANTDPCVEEDAMEGAP